VVGCVVGVAGPRGTVYYDRKLALQYPIHSRFSTIDTIMATSEPEDELKAAFASAGSLRTWRAKQIRKDIAEWGERPIEFGFNPQGTPLYTIEETLRAFARRYSTISECIERLDKKVMLVPATILARALIETIAIGCLLAHDITRLLKPSNRDRFDSRMEKYFAGMASRDVKPVHVMDGIRHLNDVDAEYFNYLAKKHEVMKKLLAKIVPNITDETDALAKAREALSVSKAYDLLSEIAHPNGLGTQFVFPDPSNETFAEGLKARLEHSCGVAIWHGHHLLKSLNSAKAFSEQYRSLYLA
jgi:predicted HD phosphohydrolase